MSVDFYVTEKAVAAACESTAAQEHCASSCNPIISGTDKVSLFAFWGLVRVISLSLLGLLEAVIIDYNLSARKRTAGAF